MASPVAVIRPDGRFWLYNRRALEYTGVREEDLPFPPTVADVFAEQIGNGEFGADGELLPKAARDFIYERKGKPPATYTRRRPDGTILEIRSDPMPDDSFIQTYTDVTEQAKAKEAAEAAADAKASFLATMSHEIRTPLNGVLGAANLLANTKLSETQRSFTELISSCGEALLVVISDILDISKFESAGVSLDPTASALDNIFSSAMQVTRSAAAAKNIGFRAEGLRRLPAAAEIDAVRLRQVLINLLGNGIKFTDVGSVTLRVRAWQGAGGWRLRVSVVDTGIGIAENAKAKLFKEFAQENSSINRRFGGTGLGLAISKKIVEAMGGIIGVNSKLDEGSEFWFEIPLILTDKPLPNTGQFRAIENELSAYRILVAEDIATNQIVICATLEAMGQSVVIASDGYEVLDALQRERFDFVMLDMQMPKMDGLEATRRIRQSKASYASVPIIAMTANAFASDREICIEAGMDGFVAKPFTPESLAGELIRLAPKGPQRTEGNKDAGSETRRDLGATATIFTSLPPAESEDKDASNSAWLSKPQVNRIAAALTQNNIAEVVDSMDEEFTGLVNDLVNADSSQDRLAAAIRLEAWQVACYDLGMAETAIACSDVIVLLRSGVAPDMSAIEGLNQIFEKSRRLMGEMIS